MSARLLVTPDPFRPRSRAGKLEKAYRWRCRGSLDLQYAQGELAGVQGVAGMVIATPGLSRLKSTFGFAALMALTGRPYIRAIVAALSPALRT